MLNFIVQLKRFNKIAGTMGPTWTCTNSVIQGCSLSLLATAALSTVWARALETEVPATLCNSVVDERRLCATGQTAPKQLRTAIHLTRDFDSHGSKIQFTQINLCDANQVDGERGAANCGPVWDEGRELRETSRLPSHTQREQRQNKRTDEATRTVARIARLPRGFGFEARARLIETNAIPRYHFAIECGMPSEQSLGGLTSQIMRTQQERT